VPEATSRAARPAGGRRKPREERWAEVVAAATEVFHERGYDAASLQDVADRVGILKGSLYYYIQSKEDLLAEVIGTAYENGLRAVREAAGGSGDPLQRLDRAVRAHVRHVCANLVGVAVYLRESSALPEARRRELLGDEEGHLAVFRNLIEQAQWDGLIHEEVAADVAAQSLLGSVNWVYRWFEPGGRFTPDEVGRELARTAMTGMATDAGLARIRELDELPAEPATS
jgi:AcrR family transcriptional regulator